MANNNSFWAAEKSLMYVNAEYASGKRSRDLCFWLRSTTQHNKVRDLFLSLACTDNLLQCVDHFTHDILKQRRLHHTHTHTIHLQIWIYHIILMSLHQTVDALYTHTHPFNSPFSGTTQVSQYQKGKTNLDFTEARDSEWQWHQLGHMQACILLQTDNHASIPPFSFLQAGCTK